MLADLTTSPIGSIGTRFAPPRATGTGVLVLAGSRGAPDDDRARVFAHTGAIAETIRWFGGEGQQPGPWLVPLETFAERIRALRVDCDRIVLIGTSFGAEAALATAAHLGGVDAVVALAPSDVVWAGVRPDGSQTSHWTVDGDALPFVPFVDGWVPKQDPPAFTDLYARSRREHPAACAAARIPVERIPEVVLITGGDDEVWPSEHHARLIFRRREEHGVVTGWIHGSDAGHRVVFPGESPPAVGMRMRRGGTPLADRALGERAWPAVLSVLHREESPDDGSPVG
ncbi:acyl-CoA thioester hydrolase/BAAT C-terminal domain-containing protein [Microbacterium sp. gxy059]|uniref:acyl-CoA thioester hydrolase/BAAT C-terminal domain-containing protein n=1 Tax=Microbacterium sp. gxy059 TaxID=2957199 RepID=UPI003D9726BE